MEWLRKAEVVLDEWFTRKLTFQLAEGARKSLADVLWIIALLVGVAQLVATAVWWRAGQRYNDAADAVNYLSRLYGNGMSTDHLGVMYYLTLLCMLVSVALLLAAVRGLKLRSKSGGWNYVFYALLVGLLIAIGRIFSEVSGGNETALLGLIAVVAGSYLLFQVRSYFTHTHGAGGIVSAEKTTAKTVTTDKTAKP
jgi:hypothetical protein